jgi:hypothetical protein
MYAIVLMGIFKLKLDPGPTPAEIGVEPLPVVIDLGLA